MKITTCLLLLCMAASSVCAMTITSGSPGNIFIAGQPIKFDIKDSQGDVSWELVDYFGKKIADGTGIVMESAGLVPGWYKLNCKDASGEAYTTIGVVLDRGNAPLPMDGHVCTDVAGAWLVSQENFENLAKMIRMAGIPWVRERLSWGGTEKERGEIDWNKYQKLADIYAAEGVHICQHWGDTPKWTHPEKSGNFCPDDLRDYYNYARAAASNFSNRIQYWEMWNEPDTNLLRVNASDTFSGMAKTVYWGLKDGNPKAKVLSGSLLKGTSPFAKCIYESGVTEYFDIFNWHIYNKPSAYPEALAAHLDLLKLYGADMRPVWLTEAGIALKSTEGPDKILLNDENQHLQCQFIPRFAAMTIAAGCDKSFFFVLPNYAEGPVRWCTLKPDMTPYPSFAALSAAANIIGVSTYLGAYDSHNTAVTSQVFSTPRGNVLVAWSDKETEIIVPTDREKLRVADIFGSESDIAAANGYVRLKVGPDAVYLLDTGKPIEKWLTGKVRPAGKLPKLNPSRVVLMGRAKIPVSKVENAYKMSDRSAFEYNVEAYNFDHNKGAKGSVEVVVPEGWSVENPKREVSLEPMGRQVLTFKMQPNPKVGDNLYKVIIRSDFGKEKIAPCVALFNYDLLALTPAISKPMDWTNAELWKPDVSTNGTLKITNLEPGTIKIDTKFSGEGDYWAYPVLEFDKPMDMSAYDGIVFDLNVPIESYASKIRIMLKETDGGYYAGTIIPLDHGKSKNLFRFVDLEHYYYWGPDPDQKFDPSSISKVVLGADVGRDYFEFECSNFELVKFDKP